MAGAGDQNRGVTCRMALSKAATVTSGASTGRLRSASKTASAAISAGITNPLGPAARPIAIVCCIAIVSNKSPAGASHYHLEDNGMSKVERLYVSALEAFVHATGRFKDGPASPTPAREGIVSFGVAIEDKEAVARYDKLARGICVALHKVMRTRRKR